MSYRVHHVHLICSDLEQMIDFFSDLLGAQLVGRRKFGTAHGATLDLNGTLINLRVAREDETVLGDSSQARYGYDHVGLEVEDVDMAYEELKAKGFSFAAPPSDFEKWRVAFFKGPDNITIELIQAKS
jgi:catechol 2,3-dioxygenase-like lactoylglutathione lyase family enzyme